MRRRESRALLLALVAALFALTGPAEAHDLFQLNGNSLRVPPGVYHEGPFYSRQYLQNYPLRPGQTPVYFRLVPFEHYGRYRLGNPIPGLTNGSVQSDRFPYRYKYGFQPNFPPPVVIDECKLIRQQDWQRRRAIGRPDEP